MDAYWLERKKARVEKWDFFRIENNELKCTKPDEFKKKTNIGMACNWIYRLLLFQRNFPLFGSLPEQQVLYVNPTSLDPLK